ELKGGFKCVLRPLEPADEKDFHEFFLAVPEQERMFIKHRVTELEVIRDWCQNIDLGRNLPLLAVTDGKIIGDATLHQQLGGWKQTKDTPDCDEARPRLRSRAPCASRKS